MKILSNAVWEVLQSELEFLRAEAKRDKERLDRLVEALSRKQNLPVVMPQAELPRFEPAKVLEKSSGWFDNKPLPKVTSPTGAKS